jgi:hypothetical protein
MAKPLKLTAFRIDAETLQGLQAIKERDGIPIGEQARRALREWIHGKKVDKEEAERERAATRPRS